MGAQGQGADATVGRWLVIPRTLVFVFNGDDVLLMKRGAHRRVFPNKYNGLGGHVERGEHPSETAIREVYEESGLTVRDVRVRGVHHIDAGADTGIVMYVFTAQADQREISVTTDEGTLEWVSVTAVAGLDVVEDLPLVLPRVLAMADDAPPYFAHVSYDAADQIVMRVG
ncbi:MAG: NUDIX domain-containing protein [Anaerolineae bacterium]|nr:NUDIX domain-containing protein [Anaerolineae bacterium]